MYFGMHKHYLKEIFTELWDPHQLNVAEANGNKKFFDHLQRIGMESTATDLVHKYNHPGVKKYKKQLNAAIMGRVEKNKPNSSAAHGKSGAQGAVHQAKKVEKKGEKFEKKVDRFFDKVASIFD